MAMITIRPIRESDVPDFHAAVDAVCREKRYLATVMSPPVEKTALFVADNVKKSYPQFVADDAGRSSAGAMRSREATEERTSAGWGWEC